MRVGSYTILDLFYRQFSCAAAAATAVALF